MYMENKNDTAMLQKICFLFLISLFIYVWFATEVLKWSGNFNYLLNYNDKVYYSNISMMLGLTGQENRNGINNLLDFNYHGLEPYHYFEMWLNAMLSSVYGSLHFVTLYLLTYTLTNFIVVLGIFALTERMCKVNLRIQVCVFMFLFTGGLYFFNKFTSQSDYQLNFGESPLELLGERFAAYYFFVLLSFLFYLSNYTTLAFLSLLIIPVISIGTLPGLIGALFLFLPLAAYFHKVTGKQFLRMSAYLLVLLLAMYIFYRVGGNTSMSPYFKRRIGYYTDLSGYHFRSIKIVIIELGFRIFCFPFKSFWLHLPFICIACLLFFNQNIKKPFRGLFLLTSLVYLSSLLAYGLFYKFPEAIQFYTNNLAFLNVFFLFSMITFFFAERPTGKYFQRIRMFSLSFVIGILICKMVFARYTYANHTAMNQIYSDSYVSEIDKINRKQKEKSWVAALVYQEKPDDDYLSFHSSYLAYMNQFYPAIKLNVFDSIEGDPSEPLTMIQKAAMELSVFAQFVKKQKEAGTFLSIEHSQVDFLKKHKIRFLIISKNMKPGPLISSRIIHTLTDSLSGQRFVVLK